MNNEMVIKFSDEKMINLNRVDYIDVISGENYIIKFWFNNRELPIYFDSEKEMKECYNKIKLICIKNNLHFI